MTDEPRLPGTLIKTHRDRWHHSIEYDGYIHTCKCGAAFDASDDVHDVHADLRTCPEYMQGVTMCYNCVLEHIKENND